MADSIFTNVTNLDIHGEIPGEVVLKTWHRIRVYRTEFAGVIKYSVHYDVSHYHFEDGQPVNDLERSEQFDYDTGAEADAKFQRMAIKAFSTTMSQRNHNY